MPLTPRGITYSTTTTTTTIKPVTKTILPATTKALENQIQRIPKIVTLLGTAGMKITTGTPTQSTWKWIIVMNVAIVMTTMVTTYNTAPQPSMNIGAVNTINMTKQASGMNVGTVTTLMATSYSTTTTITITERATKMGLDKEHGKPPGQNNQKEYGNNLYGNFPITKKQEDTPFRESINHSGNNNSNPGSHF